jgi:hypothetical protein
MTRTTRTPVNATGYNYTVFRFEEGSDRPMSVQVVEYRDGRLLRCNAFGCSGHEGKASFHAYYMSQMGTFAGRPVRLMMVPTTKVYASALLGTIAKTWEAHAASAIPVPPAPVDATVSA